VDRLANHAVYGVPHQRTDLVLFPAEEREHGPIRLDGAVADQPAQDPAEFKRALGAKAAAPVEHPDPVAGLQRVRLDPAAFRKHAVVPREAQFKPFLGDQTVKDRKSTRLNSSHVKISYAVFCLKKKKEK